MRVVIERWLCTTERKKDPDPKMAMVSDPCTLSTEETEVKAWRAQAQPVLYSETLERVREGDGERGEEEGVDGREMKQERQR